MKKYICKSAAAAFLSAFLLCSVCGRIPAAAWEPEIESAEIAETPEALKTQNYMTVRVHFLQEEPGQILMICSDTAMTDYSSVDGILYMDQFTPSETGEYEFRVPLAKILALPAEEGKKTLYIQFADMNMSEAAQYVFTFDAFTVSTIYGDVNGDGAVDPADAQRLMWHILNPEKYPISTERTDFNGDGTTNLKDAAYLAHHTRSPEAYPLIPEEENGI